MKQQILSRKSSLASLDFQNLNEIDVSHLVWPWFGFFSMSEENEVRYSFNPKELNNWKARITERLVECYIEEVVIPTLGERGLGYCILHSITLVAQFSSKVMEKIKRSEIPLTRFYIIDYIFDETVTFMECVLNNHELALKLGKALQTSPLATLIRIDEDLFRESWGFFKQNEYYSFIDCISFQATKRHGIDSTFTFDEHFRNVGIKTVP